MLYTDGLRPDEIASYLKSIRNVKGFFENDLEKQDRQTDEHIIDFEMYMYEMLGMNKMVLSMWKTVHMSWQFKSNFGSGSREAMRLTGQATTALGNVVTNMVVHA